MPLGGTKQQGHGALTIDRRPCISPSWHFPLTSTEQQWAPEIRQERLDKKLRGRRVSAWSSAACRLAASSSSSAIDVCWSAMVSASSRCPAAGPRHGENTRQPDPHQAPAPQPRTGSRHRLRKRSGLAGNAPPPARRIRRLSRCSVWVRRKQAGSSGEHPERCERLRHAKSLAREGPAA
jgi:hypothetical protein